MAYKVNFVNQKKQITVKEGTLAEACLKAGFPINMVCGGRGTCGKCKVQVRRDGIKKQVLACKTVVEQDEEVYLDVLNYEKVNVLTESREDNIRKNPSLKKRFVNKKELLSEQEGELLAHASVEIMKKFADIISEKDFSGCTLVYFNEEVIDVQKGDLSEKCYGAAIDIGTTTVVVYLYDLIHNKLIATKSGLNKQIVYGADVISRITFSQKTKENLLAMKDLILDTINKMLREAGETIEDIYENLYHVVLCGNSTMQHLFLGLNPTYLGSSPFASITKHAVFFKGKESGLRCANEAVIEFLPLLGGFVGADTTSVLLTLEEKPLNYLMVDLGTNGEIAVGNYEGFLVASTACGPALEGGNIDCGMRGTQGAIEKVSLENDKINLKVIGGGKPQGLCGSGILDAVAELRRIGIINEAGTLLSAQEYEQRHPDSSFSKMIKEIEKYNLAFFFTDEENGVYISQKDIRQIQMAKSSIYTGCMTLLKEYGIKVDEIDRLILSGAFGNYIDIKNALFLGLLPSVEKNKIFSIGNGAGRGVQSVLLDKTFRNKIKRISERTTHVELASHSDFMEAYIENMNFV